MIDFGTHWTVYGVFYETLIRFKVGNTDRSYLEHFTGLFSLNEIVPRNYSPHSNCCTILSDGTESVLKPLGSVWVIYSPYGNEQLFSGVWG